MGERNFVPRGLECLVHGRCCMLRSDNQTEIALQAEPLNQHSAEQTTVKFQLRLLSPGVP